LSRLTVIAFYQFLGADLNQNPMQQTPLILEVNTKTTKLREVVDKVIKSKLGLNLPSVMIGSTFVFEDGDDLEEDEAVNYALNLEKVLFSYSSYARVYFLFQICN
jgi:hypothetical protein